MYTIGTPIGNLEDITVRALEIIKTCDYLVSENPTTTLKLLNKYEIKKTVRSYREDSHARMSGQILSDVGEKGLKVGVVSEAGTPLVSDPGAKLLHDAYEAGITVIPIPGPSAVTTAVSAFPLVGTKYLFWGFAPRKEGEFSRMILDHLELLVKNKTALVFFESPFRLKKTLGYLDKITEKLFVDVDVKVGVGKEMTKMFEAYKYGYPRDILSSESQDFKLDKGEATLVITFKKRQNTGNA